MVPTKQAEGGRNSVVVRLHPGREKPLQRGSPWIYSGAIAAVEGTGSAGAVAEVMTADGQWVGRGLYQPGTNPAVRLLTTHPAEVLDETLIRRRIQNAVRLRHQCFGSPPTWNQTNAYRMIFSEADGLPGLIADQYAQAVVLQFDSEVWRPWVPVLAAELKTATGAQEVFPRAADETAGKDGAAMGAEPPRPRPVAFLENGFHFEADLASGQKTGFYLDQRDNRRRVAAYARGRDVLSAYCYTGAFEVAAARAGARTIRGWDSSAPALAQARRHHGLNPTGAAVEYETVSVPQRLRQARDRGESWDLIILDPPRLVTSRGGLEKGLRAYKDINLLAIKLLRPGGILATFSCSGWVDRETFRRMLGWAAHDAGRPLRILETLGQPPDHPIPIGMPECEYLKGFICVAD